MAIQEAPKLHCVDAAAADAENHCKWCLASPLDIVWDFLFQNLWIFGSTLPNVYNMPHTFYLVIKP